LVLLENRKGTLIIEAKQISLLVISKRCFILLVGKKAENKIFRLMNEKISLIKEATNVGITWDNQFVSYNEMMKSLFDQSVILLPYKKHRGFEADFLSHAAAANKSDYPRVKD
jgi:hypothetical protein